MKAQDPALDHVTRIELLPPQMVESKIGREAFLSLRNAGLRSEKKFRGYASSETPSTGTMSSQTRST